MAIVTLALALGFVWAVLVMVLERFAWRRFKDTVAPPDDLRRADDGYLFPDEDIISGWS